MSRFSEIDLSAYPITDVLEALSFEAYLARDRADLAARWNVRRVANPTLPPYDALFLESDPSSVVLEVGAYRETLLRGRINDAIRQLTLAGATGAALDHIGITYYRTPRLEITAAANGQPAVMEEDESYRQRLAIVPESWSTAGPVGAYVFWAMSASGDVLDVGVYSEDEGVCLAPLMRVVVLSRSGDGTASPALLQAVRDALGRADRRPMADQVIVESAVPVLFDLAIHLILRPGASPATVVEAARARVENYCAGRLRYAGGIDGPVYVVGRSYNEASIAGVAMGGDQNILSVDITGGDINPVPAGYSPALAGVGTRDFMPLDPALTAHLFRAPRLNTLTITHEIGAWGGMA